MVHKGKRPKAGANRTLLPQQWSPFWPRQAYLGAPTSHTSLLEDTPGKENQAGIFMGHRWAPRYLTHSLEVLGNPRVSWLACRAASSSHLQHRVYLGLPVDESQPLEL